MTVVGRRHLWALALAAAAFHLDCASAQDAPRSGPEAWAYIQATPAERRALLLQKEAEREGAFTLYAAIGIDQLQVLQRLFAARYPKVKMQFVRVVASELLERASKEDRAQKVAGDGFLFGTEMVEVLQPYLAPFEPSAWSDIDDRFKFGSYSKGATAFSFMMTPTTIAWRTDRVPSSDAPKTLAAISDPKWKGRVGAASPILPALLDALEKDLGESETEKLSAKLAALKPSLYESIGATSQALASGEFDVTFNFGGDRAKQLKKAGAPIDYVMADPLYTFATMVAPVKKASNPYSIALFVDFLASVDGSQAYDATEEARFFGNRKGVYANKLADFPNLKPYRIIPLDKFTSLRGRVDSLFVR